MKIYLMSIQASDFLVTEEKGQQIDLTRALQIKSDIDQSRWPRIDSLPKLFALTGDPIGLLRDTQGFIESHRLGDELRIPKRAKVVAPIRRPPKLLGLGLNYRPAPGQAPPPFKTDSPILFMKPSSSVIGPGERIILPEDIGQIIHEAELAVVIGKAGRNIHAEDAHEHIFGYTVHNDVTAMDVLKQDFPTIGSWTRAKFCDTFSPLGPCVLTADEAGTPPEMEIICRVNGEIRQQGTTGEMIMDVRQIIETLSRRATLEPGDVICCGSPPGSGPLQSGDLVECEIPPIGVLANHAIGESFESRANLDSKHDAL